jgi:ABC-type transport system involved in Fe-S cluster assembly fused permease/ATPase subunit
MATEKQSQAAKKNVRKAAKAAREQKTIAKLPKKTRTALGKQGAAVAQRKRGVVPGRRLDKSCTKRQSDATCLGVPR